MDGPLARTRRIMPSFIDSPEEIAAIITLVIVAIGSVIVTLITTLGSIIAAAWAFYHKQLAPILNETRNYASRTAHEVTENHGTSMKDAMLRFETKLDRMDEKHTITHREIFRRLYNLENKGKI